MLVFEFEGWSCVTHPCDNVEMSQQGRGASAQDGSQTDSVVVVNANYQIWLVHVNYQHLAADNLALLAKIIKQLARHRSEPDL